MLHGHGNDKYNSKTKIVADFSSNVWFKPMPETYYNELGNVFKKLGDYPHPEAAGLKKKLAQFHSVTDKNIWVTNGSVQGIYLLAQIFANHKSAIVCPSFSEYEDACKRYNHKMNYIDSHNKRFQTVFQEDVVWFGHPNNPDGKTLRLANVEFLLHANPSTLFIIDEAFAELCLKFESAISLLNKYKNLVILRSLTKAFAIPGIRLGYILAEEGIIERVKEMSIPWSVNSVAIKAGEIILRNYEKLLPCKQEIKQLNHLLFNELSGIQQLEVFPSETNFLLVRIKNRSGAELKKYLLENYGLLIRDASNFRGLDESYIRLSLQTKENIMLLVKAFKLYFNESRMEKICTKEHNYLRLPLDTFGNKQF